MSINKEQEKYIKEIADKINNGKIVSIEDRPLSIKDVEQLGDYDRIETTHKKGFNIIIRKEYHLDTILNIPVLMFSGNYVVEDELMGVHGIEWTLEEVVEYANGLLGY